MSKTSRGGHRRRRLARDQKYSNPIIESAHQQSVDGRISWCRLFRVGPPCPRLCGSCAVTERALEQSYGLPDAGESEP